ncbi:MAG: MFS transporter [Brevundimonas sp.]
MEEREVSRLSQPRRMTLFLAAYLLLFLATFLGLAPVFQIIAPLHAGALDPDAKTEILSRAMFWGALVAAASNLIIGAISDRTRSRFGRRRPWIAIGVVLTILSYIGLWRASTPAEFIWAVVGFQLAFNTLMAPLSAVFADRVPLALRSTISALLGLSYPLAVALGSSLMALGPQTEPGRFILLGALLVTAAVIFLLSSREPDRPSPLNAASGERPWRAGLLITPFQSRNFSVVWGSRLLIATGYSFVSTYLLFFITDALGRSGSSPERFHALLTGVGFASVIVVTVVVALFGKKIIHRQSVALVGAIILCAATVLLSTSANGMFAIIAFAAYGIGQGAYGAVEMGLMADALPSAEDRGRDMGLNNLAVALPQAIAPLAALVLTATGGDVRTLYIAASGCFAGAVVVLGLFRRTQGDSTL